MYQARVQDGGESDVLLGPDQPAETLLQGEGRLRHRIAGEPVAGRLLGPVGARPVQGIRRHREGQLVNHQQGERISRNVHAFPERADAQQDRVRRLPERVQQRRVTAAPLLAQHRKRTGRPEHAAHAFQVSPTREQEESPAPAGADQMEHLLGGGIRKPRVAGFHQIPRHVEPRLILEPER